MHKKDSSHLEDSLGYSFKKKGLLQEALTHGSFSHENPGRAGACNERLEFLGDSVLGFIIVEYLFLYSGTFSESFMSKTKSYIVQASVLSEIAGALSLGDYLRLGKGEEATGGRTKKSLLADSLEAVLGAVYLDGGYKKVKDVILRLFRERIDVIIRSGRFHDFKSELQEKTQFDSCAIPEYRLLKEEGKEHKKIFTIEVYVSGEKLGEGRGRSKKEAEAAAAKEALGKLAE